MNEIKENTVNIMTTVSISCQTCDECQEEHNVSERRAIELFNLRGWREIDGRVYCRKCVKQQIKGFNRSFSLREVEEINQ